MCFPRRNFSFLMAQTLMKLICYSMLFRFFILCSCPSYLEHVWSLVENPEVLQDKTLTGIWRALTVSHSKMIIKWHSGEKHTSCCCHEAPNSPKATAQMLTLTWLRPKKVSMARTGAARAKTRRCLRMRFLSRPACIRNDTRPNAAGACRRRSSRVHMSSHLPRRATTETCFHYRFMCRLYSQFVRCQKEVSAN